MWKQIADVIKSGYDDDDRRRIVVFNLLNVLLGVIAGVMTLLNLGTQKYVLMGITAAFSLLCLGNCLMTQIPPASKMREGASYLLFSLGALAMLGYFVVSGNPEGFSVLWTLLVPTLGLSVFGMRIGSRLSAATFLMIIFFFWMPLGQGLLQYAYSETFMMRFPVVYICLYLGTAYLEMIRMRSHQELIEARQTAMEMYRHDALTGLYTRYAFSEVLKQMYDTPSVANISVALYDIDDFKVVNDHYGHNAGDEVLKTVAKILQENTCEHCIVCRWGGEEFLVLMQCNHDALETAKRIQRIVENTAVFYEDASISVTLSAGVAVTKHLSASQLSNFINSADKAMYASKQSGKNQTTRVVFDGQKQGYYPPKKKQQPDRSEQARNRT